MTFDDLSIREVDLQKVLPLRTSVLRPHVPPGTFALFDQDQAEHTRHFAALLNSQIVAVLSIYLRPLPDSPPPPPELANDPEALHLRGMAVVQHLQGHGVGSLLLSTVLTRLPLSYPLSRVIWCNARQPARSFYQRHGFQSIGPPFDVPEIGPHLRMARTLPAALATS